MPRAHLFSSHEHTGSRTSASVDPQESPVACHCARARSQTPTDLRSAWPDSPPSSGIFALAGPQPRHPPLVPVTAFQNASSPDPLQATPQGPLDLTLPCASVTPHVMGISFCPAPRGDIDVFKWVLLFPPLDGQSSPRQGGGYPHLCACHPLAPSHCSQTTPEGASGPGVCPPGGTPVSVGCFCGSPGLSRHTG